VIKLGEKKQSNIIKEIKVMTILATIGLRKKSKIIRYSVLYIACYYKAVSRPIYHGVNNDLIL
jgi:hypothetical protein